MSGLEGAVTAAEYNASIAATMREATLQAQVDRLAKSFGWLTYHTHRSDRSAPGFPDLVMVRGTRIIGAELKSARGTVTPAQTTWLTALAGANVETYLWRPLDMVEGRILAVLR